MNEAVTLILAILAVLVQAALVALALAWGGSHVLGWPRRVLDGLAAGLRDSALPLAAGVATVATLGSLYFSEVAGYTPCLLCWYQRIAMYPLALVLLIATVRNDRDVRPYALPLAGIGAAIAAYHYQLQVFPDQSAVSCDASAPCTARFLNEFGYITIPMLALTAFAAVIALLLLDRRAERLGRVSSDGSGSSR